MLTKLSTVLLLSFFTIFVNNKKVITNSKNSVVIYFHLEKNQKCILSYTNIFLEGREVVFSNPGDRDTTIVKVIEIETSLSLGYNIGNLNTDNQLQFIRYSLLVNPGDTLHLSYVKFGYLNTKNCNQSTILSDATTSFYADENLNSAKNVLSKNEAWISFYRTFSKNYTDEINRIKMFSFKGRIDSISYQRFLINCKLHYYKRLFDWLFEKDSGYYKPCLDIIIENIPGIESTLNNKYLFLSNELLPVIDGMVRAKIIRKGKNYSDGFEVYKEASMSSLGKFKPGYLTVCIVKYPLKQGKEFNIMLNNYKSTNLNITYFFHVDSVLKSILEGNKIFTNDLLIKADKTTVSWDKLMKSEKSFVIIDFWASWCKPCREQLPYIERMKLKLKKYPLDFVSINIDENIDDWKIVSNVEKKFLTKNNYHLFNAKKSNIIKRLKLTSIPRYLLLHNAKIVSSSFFQPTDPSFEKKVIELMNTEKVK